MLINLLPVSSSQKLNYLREVEKGIYEDVNHFNLGRWEESYLQTRQTVKKYYKSLILEKSIVADNMEQVKNFFKQEINTVKERYILLIRFLSIDTHPYGIKWWKVGEYVGDYDKTDFIYEMDTEYFTKQVKTAVMANLFINKSL